MGERGLQLIANFLLFYDWAFFHLSPSPTCFIRFLLLFRTVSFALRKGVDRWTSGRCAVRRGVVGVVSSDDSSKIVVNSGYSRGFLRLTSSRVVPLPNPPTAARKSNGGPRRLSRRR